MKKFLLRKLIKWYLRENREISKCSVEEEYFGFLFSSPKDTQHLIRCMLTAQTVRHWEAKNEEDRQIVKGSGLILKILKDGHEAAQQIKHHYKDPIEQLEQWDAYRKKHRTN